MSETLPFTIRSTKLGIVSGITFGRDEGGLQISSRHAEPYWQGTFTTPPLTRAQRIAALAALDDFVDLNLRVDFVHPIYTYPAGFGASSWPMVGDATLLSVTDRRNIVVSGLTGGMLLPVGTRLTIIQGADACYRKIRAAVPSTDPVSQAINIGPRLPPGIFSGGASVRLSNPFVRMMVVPDSWDAEEDIEDIPLSFDMSETLR